MAKAVREEMATFEAQVHSLGTHAATCTLDDARATLFEATRVSARYTWTDKWEFEGRHSFARLENGQTFTGGLVRRYGHDFVFELEFEQRDGEGGSSFGFNLRPRVGFDRSRLSSLGVSGR